MREEPGNPSRNRLQTTTLLDAIQEHQFDAVFGGARRDEEKARAKERVFSLRDEFGQWEPQAPSGPSCGACTTAGIRKGQHMRVFPISNWTEMDVWQYIEREGLEVPVDLLRPRARRLPARRHVALDQRRSCRSAPTSRRAHGRPLPDGRRHDLHRGGRARPPRPSTEIILEVAAARITERGATRADDAFSETAMEDRKREGYF